MTGAGLLEAATLGLAPVLRMVTWPSPNMSQERVTGLPVRAREERVMVAAVILIRPRNFFALFCVCVVCCVSQGTTPALYAGEWDRVTSFAGLGLAGSSERERD
jgi:hypothetical protein